MNDPFGLLTPFQRGSRDFAAGSGPPLLSTKTKQVLMTEPGELPWRTAFGAGLGRLRHERNDAVLGELARVRVRDAFGRWLPSARLVALQVVGDGASLFLRVRVTDRTTIITTEADLRP